MSSDSAAPKPTSTLAAIKNARAKAIPDVMPPPPPPLPIATNDLMVRLRLPSFVGLLDMRDGGCMASLTRAIVVATEPRTPAETKRRMHEDIVLTGRDNTTHPVTVTLHRPCGPNYPSLLWVRIQVGTAPPADVVDYADTKDRVKSRTYEFTVGTRADLERLGNTIRSVILAPLRSMPNTSVPVERIKAVLDELEDCSTSGNTDDTAIALACAEELYSALGAECHYLCGFSDACDPTKHRAMFSTDKLLHTGERMLQIIPCSACMAEITTEKLTLVPLRLPHAECFTAHEHLAPVLHFYAERLLGPVQEDLPVYDDNDDDDDAPHTPPPPQDKGSAKRKIAPGAPKKKRRSV